MNLKATFLLGLWTTACGQATFSGGSTKAPEGEPTVHERPDSPESPASPDSPEASSPPGTSGSSSPDAPVPGELALACTNWEDQTAHLEAKPGPTRVKGRICEPAAAEVEIVLLVDTSTSMKKTDPTAQGSCGRLRAAEALAKAAAGANLKVITFGDRAQISGNDVSAASLCVADGQTNYAAALDAVTALMKQSPDRRHGLYLISDGLPDVFAQRDPMGQGLAAAERLRAEVPDLQFNALYFGPTASGEDPEAYLRQVVGAQGEVRVVQDAAALAQAILQVKAPTPLSREDFRLDVTWEGGPKLTVRAATLAPVPGQEGTLEFTTESFDLSELPAGTPVALTWRRE